jgi:raffinose/stachyose/melibiose transport system substrate-binding protein
MARHTRRRLLLLGSAGVAMSLALAGSSFGQDPVTITYYIANEPTGLAATDALIKGFEAANPGIKVEIETRPNDASGDSMLKTRLATGEMDDVFNYNTGSLFQALNPEQTLVDLTNEPFQANVVDSFKSTVNAKGHLYGGPGGTAMGGGVLYNKKIFNKLGLSVPKSWAEFLANSQKIKGAGIPPVIQTFGTSWTAQLFVLGDFYNVITAEPNFAADYTANKVKYATDPAALKGFQRQEDVFKAGFLNPDYGSAELADGIRMVALGEGAQYPMLSFAIGTVATTYPDNLADVGFFALPGDDAAKNGLTVWMPGGLYVPKTSQHVEEAKKFVAYVASVAGCEAQTGASTPTGPYVVKGCTLPATVPPAVADLLPYFQTDGKTAPALEFLSPVKGPLMPQITVEVGSGIRSAVDGAALYDEDVKKQAQQLGLPGW